MVSGKANGFKRACRHIDNLVQVMGSATEPHKFMCSVDIQLEPQVDELILTY